MGILILRTTDDQDQAIREVKKLLKHSTLSKTILRCVINDQNLLTILEVANAKTAQNLTRVNKLEGLITNNV